MSSFDGSTPVEPEVAAAPVDRKEAQNAKSNPSEEAALPECKSEASLNSIEQKSASVSTTGGTTHEQSGNHQIHSAKTFSKTTTTPRTEKVKSARDMLAENAQSIIEELNNKRAQDTQMLTDFKTNLELHTQRVVQQTEDNLFKMYEKQSAIVQHKLQVLNNTLQRIDQLEAEMQQFKQALGILHADMNEK